MQSIQKHSMVKLQATKMSVNVNVCNIKSNPHCAHGPTVLFSRSNNSRRFYACSACRDRKDCSFFVYEDELNKVSNYKKNIWEMEKKKYIGNINHIKLYTVFNKVAIKHHFFC